MGVDTKAIIRKGVTIEQIEKVMVERYAEVKVHTSSFDFMYISFKDGEDQRNLAISFSNSCERDIGIAGVWISIGCWGNSVEILKYLCETFGGYLDENDCDEEGFYPINFELYKQGVEFTELDLFKNKVISKFGFDSLKKAMDLFEEFRNVTKN